MFIRIEVVTKNRHLQEKNKYLIFQESTTGKYKYENYMLKKTWSKETKVIA